MLGSLRRQGDVYIQIHNSLRKKKYFSRGLTLSINLIHGKGQQEIQIFVFQNDINNKQMFNDTMSKCSSETSQGCRFKLAICTACHELNLSPFFINCSSIYEPGLKMFSKPTEDKFKTFLNTINGTILTLYIISMVSLIALCYLCFHLKTILYKGINIHTHTLLHYSCMHV